MARGGKRAGAGRPRTGDRRIRVTVALPEPVARALILEAGGGDADKVLGTITVAALCRARPDLPWEG